MLWTRISEILSVNDELIKLGKGMIKKDDILNKNLLDVYPFLTEKRIDLEYDHVLRQEKYFKVRKKHNIMMKLSIQVQAKSLSE